VTLEDARGLWVRSTEWDVNWLLAGPQAPPLRVRFSIPNGEYRVTPHIRGNAILRFQSGERVELDGPDYELGTRPRGEAVDAGHVTITDQTFRAEIRPTGPEFFVLQMIGFEPLGTGSGEESADSGLLERLKSLGYIK
jgi:hypothetical protein